MPESHALRRERLRAAVAASDVDAALITTLVNVRYLTGLASSNAALLVPAAGAPVLATDSRYALAAERDCPDIQLLTARPVETALAELAVSQGLVRLAFEAQEMTVERHTALAATDGLVLLVPLGQCVEQLRVVKDTEELALLGRACAITGWAFDRAVPRIRPGMTERELAVLIERAMVDAGAEKPAFDTIVASGTNGAIPHHAPGGRRFEPGDMITVDCGARYAGYHADMTRTVMLGEPAAWQREIYGLVAAAQRAGIDAAVPRARPSRMWTRRRVISSPRPGTTSTSATAWATAWGWRSMRRRWWGTRSQVHSGTGFPSPSNRASTCPAWAA